MILSHKIALDPTFKQQVYFKKACGISRFTYNWALSAWQEQYQQGLKPTGFKLKKMFNAIKKDEFPWMYEVTKYASQQPFIYLQKAFSKFFNKEAKYPKYKKKGVHDSFYIGCDHFQVSGRTIRLPKLGWVRLREKLRFCGKIVSATISRVAHQWFVSIQVDVGELNSPCENQASVGVDLGVKQLATIYDGINTKIIAGPKPLKRRLKKLKRLQRHLSKCQKHSKNRNKRKMQLSKLHYRIRCVRLDTLHKLTTELTTRYQTISIEDLNVKGMMQNRRLSRAISDMGFYEFRRQLEYKSKIHGNFIHVNDRWFPSSKQCHKCQMVNQEMTLTDRQFHCVNCGCDIDRDENAAINLFNTVSSTEFQACGEESAGFTNCKVKLASVKQELSHDQI